MGELAITLSDADVERIAQRVAKLISSAGERPSKNHTLAEAATESRLSLRCIKRLTSTGKLRTVRIGRRVFVPADAMSRLLSEGTAR